MEVNWIVSQLSNSIILYSLHPCVNPSVSVRMLITSHIWRRQVCFPREVLAYLGLGPSGVVTPCGSSGSSGFIDKSEAICSTVSHVHRRVISETFGRHWRAATVMKLLSTLIQITFVRTLLVQDFFKRNDETVFVRRVANAWPEGARNSATKRKLPFARRRIRLRWGARRGAATIVFNNDGHLADALDCLREAVYAEMNTRTRGLKYQNRVRGISIASNRKTILFVYFTKVVRTKIILERLRIILLFIIYCLQVILTF